MVPLMAAKIILTVVIFASAAWCHPDAINHIRNEASHVTIKSHRGPVKNVGIIGGHQISIEQAPFMISLRLNGEHWCGGAIIHERFVITAAHCVPSYFAYQVLVGTDNIHVSGQLYDIEDIIIHQDYDYISMDNDVAIIKLNKPLSFSPKVAKLSLISPQSKLHEGTTLNVTGWGSTGENRPLSSHLRQVEVPLVSIERCKEYFGESAITTHMICAGTYGRDSCSKDSGGPLTLGNELVGIVSFGTQYDCGSTPGVYTKIASIINWIQKQLTVIQKQ